MCHFVKHLHSIFEEEKNEEQICVKLMKLIKKYKNEFEEIDFYFEVFKLYFKNCILEIVYMDRRSIFLIRGHVVYLIKHFEHESSNLLDFFLADFKKLIYLKRWIQVDMQIKCVNCKKERSCLQCKFFTHFLDICNQTEYRDKIILLARN